MSPQTSVTREVHLSVPPARAFAVFADMGSWWLQSHSTLDARPTRVVLEPFAGGRWYETGADGSHCDWGRVLEWHPPRRMVLQWSLDAEFRFDPELVTEVEVTFEASGEGTLLRLVHRGLDAYGDRMGAMLRSFSSDGGWRGLLASCAARAGDGAGVAAPAAGT